MVKKVSSYTLGCKLNFSETSALSESLCPDGFEVVPFGAASDVVIINTCSVTDNANKKCRNIVRRTLRHSPSSFVVVMGCYAQLEPSEIAAIEGVDLILGTKEKFSFRETLSSLTLKKNDKPIVMVSNINEVEDFGYGHSLKNSNHREQTRSYLKVQDGCDYSCSYCTIPLARGASRSPSIESIANEAMSLVHAGYKEIVLTGVNIGDFGANSNEGSFYDLLTTLEKLPIERIRISSIEPNLLTSQIIDFISQSERIVPHFHVPMQSGSDTMLKYMQRRYRTSLYKERILEIVEKIPDCCIGADVIVGFLGETDTEFEESYRFIESLPLAYLHLFTFSMRKNTKAEKMSTELQEPPLQVKHARRNRLEAISSLKRKKFNERFLGNIKSVLFEDDFSDSPTHKVNPKPNLMGNLNEHVKQHNEPAYCYGFTDNYVRVGVPVPSTEIAKRELHGQFKMVKLMLLNNEHSVTGELI